MQIKNKNFGQTNQPKFNISQIRSKHRALQIVVVAIFRFSFFVRIAAEYHTWCIIYYHTSRIFVSFILGTGIIFISFWFLVQVISLLWLLWLEWSIQSPFHQTNILCVCWWWWSSFSFSFCFLDPAGFAVYLCDTYCFLVGSFSSAFLIIFSGFFLQKLDSGFAISSNVEWEWILFDGSQTHHVCVVKVHFDIHTFSKFQWMIIIIMVMSKKKTKRNKKEEEATI